MKGTIKNKEEIDFIFKKGNKINTKSILILIDENKQREPLGRVAFVAGKKLGNSPKRNYAKRIMRHAFYEANIDIKNTNIIFVAKKNILNTNFLLVVKDIKTSLKSLNKI